ncbi:MAG: zf-HC2 domain-containing protein [Planctomycetes bacterium]|nr:zf-HC2 domain-containing protein [Planctomycetota bacterium]
MNCAKVHRYLTLYLDSELSPETTYEITHHLERCEDCRGRMEGELRFEETFRKIVSKGNAAGNLAWDRAWAKTFGWRRRRVVIGLAAAASLALVAGALVMFVPHRETDLALAMLKSHEQYLAGAMGPAVETDDPDRLTNYFSGKFSFAPSLGRPPGDVKLLGGRCCYLDRSPCAYLMAHAGNTAVSFFLADASQLSAFPEAAGKMKEGVFRCRAGPFHVLAFRDGNRLVGAIGELSAKHLESVTRALVGTK